MEEQAGKKNASSITCTNAPKKAWVSGTAYVNWANKGIPAKKQGAPCR